jgi:hypothetical protein
MNAYIPKSINSRQPQDTLTLLKILALGNQQIKAGSVHSAKDVCKRIRNNREKPGT